MERERERERLRKRETENHVVGKQGEFEFDSLFGCLLFLSLV
jgi:hypothetical protein